MSATLHVINLDLRCWEVAAKLMLPGPLNVRDVVVATVIQWAEVAQESFPTIQP